MLRQQSPRGGKMGSGMNIVHKKIDFWSSTNFKLLSQIKGNPISNFDFFLSLQGQPL
jgi:hypothetical protein